MNGIHDMGGLHGFGEVHLEHDEPVFHTRWEGRVFCMTQMLDTLEIWNLDEHRHEIELMDAEAYLTVGYYGRWLFAMERLLTRKNIIAQEEIDLRVADYLSDTRSPTPLPTRQHNWPLRAEARIRWGAWRKEAEVEPRYHVGDCVRVRNIHPEGHTRVTAYARGKRGMISIVNNEAWVFPDTRAHYRGENLQPVYNVRFDASELWGMQAEAGTYVHIDLSEDHLEPDEGTMT